MLSGFLFQGASVAIQTTISQLEEVQAAITKTLIAQSWNQGESGAAHAHLSALEAREKTLLARFYKESGQRLPVINTGIKKR